MFEQVKLNGLTMTVGRPEAGAPPRPPILFVHGMFGGAWYFEKYQRFFTGRGHPTYALDLRGHHGSRPVAELGRVSVNEFVADALEAANHIGRPVIIGHSMGGLIAQKLAEADAVRAAVFLCAAPPRGIIVSSPTLIWKQLKYLPELLRSMPLVATAKDNDDVTLNRVPAAERPALNARFVAESGRAGLEISLGLITVDAGRIRCPVLSVTASDDRFVAPRVGRQIAAKYGVPVLEFPGHGHFILWEPGWEQPAAEIAAWVDRAPEGAPAATGPGAGSLRTGATGVPLASS
jgi:pimeloyl-ACP methyl ester carboxylesterase